MASALGSARTRTACGSCTRRKVRCSKTTPCDACVRRGEQDTCCLETLEPSPSHGQPTSYRDAVASELGLLQRRVMELESQACQMSFEVEMPQGLQPVQTVPNNNMLLAETLTACRVHPSRNHSHHLQNESIAVDSEGSENGKDNDGISGTERGSYSERCKDRRDTGDTMINDAASILEFLAWGRRKDLEYHPNSRRSSSTVASADLPEASLSVYGGTTISATTVKEPVPEVQGESGDVAQPFWRSKGAGQHGGNMFSDESHTLAIMQLLLPSRRQVEQLVDHHQECLLWYHASFFAPRFRADLANFYEQHAGSIENPKVDLQWVALLFAVLTGSLTCAPVQQALAWGFRDPERHTLCKNWFQAALECLNYDQYMANHSILSCQAIATMTISAHLLGFSNTQSIQLAAAVRIAQSLGLHRLGVEVGAARGPANAAIRGDLVETEMGRRVWNQLCSQDWFGISFSESYLVNPVHSQTSRPTNCHDEDLVSPLPEHEPTVSGYCRFLNTIATIMPQLHDGLLSCNTAYTRYQQVLAWDAHMRTLATSDRPLFLSSQVPLEPHWPCWVPWARRALAISSGHKIIMIHRSFLSESFTNSALAFTRNTCIAASKTIIKEYNAVVCEDGPTLWVHQAFAVAASIILMLDVLHQRPVEYHNSGHGRLVENVVEILCQFPNSMIAVRGIKLLRALLAEVARPTAKTVAVATANEDSQATGNKVSLESSRKRKRTENAASAVYDDGRRLHPLADQSVPGLGRQPNVFSVPAFIRRYCQGNKADAHRQSHQKQQPVKRSYVRRRPVGFAHTSLEGIGTPRTAGSPSKSVGTSITSPLVSPSALYNHSSYATSSYNGDLENFDTECTQQMGTEGMQNDGQLDTPMPLPPGWESINNGFENLLYLANHDFSLL